MSPREHSLSTVEVAAPLPAAEAVAAAADILVVDDDAKTLVALGATLGELGQRVVTAASGDEALLRLLEQEFAVLLLDIKIPDIGGFELAELIRAREKTRHLPIIFVTGIRLDAKEILRGYQLGAVDFLFKPVPPEVLRAKAAVFVELTRQRLALQQRTRQVREAQAREHARLFAEERQRWEAETLRQKMEKERRVAEDMAERAQQLARAVLERDAAVEALARSNARLELLSSTANQLLIGRRPRAILGDVYERLSAHLALEVYTNYLVDEEEGVLVLDSYGGLEEAQAARGRTLRIGEDVSGRVAHDRRRLVAEHLQSRSDGETQSLRDCGLSAYACFPLLADDGAVAHGALGGDNGWSQRLIGTVAFGTRCRPHFTADELALLQVVADQIAIAMDRARLIDELRLRAAELADADRRKDEFLAMLAHELRNPLAPIVNALHVLGLPPRDAHTAARAQRVMERQVRQLVRLVDDLLDVSRITQGRIELRREHCELGAVLELAVQAARPLVEAREHRLIVEGPRDPVALWADPTRLVQVVSNLLNNAAKYTQRGGVITLRAERVDDEAVIRVRDTGIGIAPDMLPRVFDLFVQGEHAYDRAAGGLGVGLTLVRRLVQLHGGEVIARSQGMGRGSEFVIALPLGQPEAQPTPAAGNGAALALVTTGPLKVLIIEDNPDIRETLKDLLEISGHQVTLAEDGPSGIAEAHKDPGHHVALVDIGLPGLDGYEVARELIAMRRSNVAPMRLIAMTGYGQAEDKRRAFEVGFDAHLVKPVDPETLTQLLGKAS